MAWRQPWLRRCPNGRDAMEQEIIGLDHDASGSDRSKSAKLILSESSERDSHLALQESRGDDLIVLGDDFAGTETTLEERRLAELRTTFLSALVRLEQIIDLETLALQQHSPPDLRDFNHRKSHGLLEMTRAMRVLEQLSSDQESLAGLERLRGKLEKNLAILESHLRAVRQISGIITRAIEAEDSDGTYSARSFKPVSTP